MPRAAVKVQGAQQRTFWSLRKADEVEEQLPPYTSHEETGDPMQHANEGRHYDNAGSSSDQLSLPRYESYDGSGYGSPMSSRTNSVYDNPNTNSINNKPLPGAPRLSIGANGQYDDFDFDATFPEPPKGQQASTSVIRMNGLAHDVPLDFGDQVRSHDITLDTKVQPRAHDPVGLHLLYETALLDAQSYEILDINEVDELKKEHARLGPRIEAANRKLVLESKVKDAAQNLQRLYSSGRPEKRPDTPQSPDSRKSGSSLMGNRGRAGSHQDETMRQAEDEYTQSVKKVDELNDQLRGLMERRLAVERKLLQHNSAVLAEQASRAAHSKSEALPNGHQSFDDDDDDEQFGVPHEGLDEFDGIRDILKGMPASSMVKKADLEKMQADHERELHNMQLRIEQLNTHLRGVITEASRTRGHDPEPQPEIQAPSHVKGPLESTLILLESNMQIMDKEREKSKAHVAQVQETAKVTQHEVEGQLEELNERLHDVLQTSAVMEALKTLREPPAATGDGYQEQLQYLGESLSMVEKVLQEHNEQLQIARQAQSNIEGTRQKAAEYETTMSGLWELVASDVKTEGLAPQDSAEGTRSSSLSAGSHPLSPSSPIREDFSLAAFSSRVQHLYDVCNGAREQQDILRRQIQQQRDLNGKSDLVKDKEIQELQARYEVLNQSYDAMQQDLAKAIENHKHADQNARDAQGELEKVMHELDQLRKTIDDAETKRKEVDERNGQIATEKDQLAADKDQVQEQLDEIQKEMQNMESELVRLTTELTVAKAELEGAYGTRAERQKEALDSEKEREALTQLKDQEIATLRREQSEKSKLLEQELQDMMTEFQEMTRESLELEKERGQLESLIDSLRERVDYLEQQLQDERMQWMGVKSPGEPGMPRESTSVTVLRQEFKKMMRESRMEGVKLLKVSSACMRYYNIILIGPA